MSESRTVTVGLDVHASSIRLAAVRDEELLEERTPPYDHEALERALRRFPHVRRLLVEAAWSARRRPQVGYAPARRQHGQDAAVLARAWRCQQRLYRRWRRMAARGKPSQKIVVACARELAGFVWAIGSNQPLRAEG